MSQVPNSFTNEIHNYLSGLRESGVCNMFGSSAYVIDEFGLSESDARECVVYWMQSFKPDKPYLD